MFKLFTKISVATLLILGIGLSLGSGKAAANACGWAPGSNWGVDNIGEAAGAMAGLTVYAHIGDYTSPDPNTGATAPSNTGSPVNTWYELSSDLPGAPQRIFQYPPGAAGRDSQHWFQAGGTMTSGPNGSNQIQCDGWDALGPGRQIPKPGGNPGETVDLVGNGWVLDCGNGPVATRYWISNIPNWQGQGGHWQVKAYNADGGLVFDSGDYFGSPSPNQYNKYFTVSNGRTNHLELVWHPNPPPPQPKPKTQTSYGCSSVDLYKPHVDGHSYTVTLNGTSADNGGAGYNPTKVKNPQDGLYYDSLHLDYTALKKDVRIDTHQYHWNGSAWIEDSGSPTTFTFHCYHASCSPSVTGQSLTVAGDGPGGIVQAGHDFTVYVPVKNNGIPPPNGAGETIPVSVGGHNFSMTESPDDYIGGTYAEHATGFSLDPGSTRTVEIKFTANGNTNNIRNLRLNFFPDIKDSDRLDDGEGCYIDVPIYQYFRIKPTTFIANGTNPEDPSLAGSTMPGISYVVGGDLQEGATTTASTYGWLTKNGSDNTVSSGTTTDRYGTNIRHQYDYPDSTIKAGDTYCPNVRISPANGFHGPNGDIYDNNETYSPGCMKVVNEPYFKAFGSSITARDGVSDSSGNCSANASNSGLLAGWNNNADSGADRGAGSQFSALALLKVTGVASAQTDMNRAPTDLTFANSDASDITQSRDSPSLGGNFGGTPVCVTPPSSSTATALPASPVTIGSLPPSSDGNYQYNGNLTISGGTVGNTSTAIYVKGNVYIRNNITYNLSGWSPGSAPSFVLVATGNIYIDPGVTQLDGVYMAQPKDSSSGGIIYTCGTAAFQPQKDFTTCNNQLLVNGSFKANNVKLLRTFGTLRDEKPKPEVPPGTQLSLCWSNAGNPGSCGSVLRTGSIVRCTQITEPGDPDTWGDNYLCVPSSSSLRLAWTYQANATTQGDRGSVPAAGSLSDLKTNGYPYCTKWDVAADYAQGWNDNYLCSNQNVGLNFQIANDPSQYCTPIRETADKDGRWAGVGYFLCEPKASPGSPAQSNAPFMNCSNAGTQMTTVTCAAEVFQFSPELYITVPAPPPPSNGAVQYDAITSLPPVL